MYIIHTFGKFLSSHILSRPCCFPGMYLNSHRENVLKCHHIFAVEFTPKEHPIKHHYFCFLPFVLSFSRAPSPALLVTVHLTQGNLKAIYPKLAEQFSVSVPFTQLEEEVEHEAQQENEIDRNMELCLKLTETPMEEVLEEREQSSCMCEERPSDDSLQSQQQCDECCTSVQSDARSKTSVPVKHCTNRDVEQEEESSEVTPSLVDTHVHPPALSAEKGPAGVVSGVSVTQLVMEQDSTPSELEASDSQPLTPSPLQVRSNREDPLSSLSVNSTPVRKYRRPAPHR